MEFGAFLFDKKEYNESMEDKHEVTVFRQIEDREFAFTYDNTMIMLFGSVALNHVYWQGEDGTSLALYEDQPLMDQLHEQGFPTYSRGDSPDWAIDRAVGALTVGMDYEP